MKLAVEVNEGKACAQGHQNLHIFPGNGDEIVNYSIGASFKRSAVVNSIM